MAKSLLLAALLGAAGLVHAAPATNNDARPARPSILEVISQLQEMKAGVEEYNRNFPEEEYQKMSRIISESAAPAAGCPKNLLVFARGTFEPGGLNNLGMLVGGPFFTQLKQGIPTVEGIGVPYSNDVFGYLIGYLGGTTPGSSIMAKQLKDKVAECPNTQIIAGGYSQGAQVTHQALQQVSADVKKNVVAVIVFGDPMKGLAIPGIDKDRIYTNCASSDPICAYLPIPLGAHLTYGSDTPVLKKIVEWTKSTLSSGPKPQAPSAPAPAPKGPPKGPPPAPKGPPKTSEPKPAEPPAPAAEPETPAE